eukprot:gb/GECH01014334.1/.p1 GENE.gb/GECH01014334.1/~~gb/GECH01014334.1/.p1  ORF type:complete len:401 (+),score=80.10 gb/GECH01014334.1/:1-1203(+)
MEGFLYCDGSDTVDERDIEQEYWRIVENADRKVQVYYGSDLGVTDHGSGFSKHHKMNWNLNVLPKLPESVLHHLKQDILGVSIPMLYIGMIFSTFAWHVEDNFLYSTNYLHHGASKTWYGVPAYAAEQFEAAMQAEVPTLFETRPDLLHHLVTMVSPLALRRHNVPVYKCMHYPGEIMVTFPHGYHGGFSNGFNFAESVNFAPGDWLSHGLLALKEYRKQRWRRSVLTYEKLLFDAAQNEPSPFIAEEVLNALKQVCNEEIKLRKQTFTQHQSLSVTMDNDNSSSPEHSSPKNTRRRSSSSTEKRITRHQNRRQLILEEEKMPVCRICQQDCFLSSARCRRCGDVQGSVCLHHLHDLCSCVSHHDNDDSQDHLDHIDVRLRFSSQEMMNLISKLTTQINE